jgi:hypothetical protein
MTKASTVLTDAYQILKTNGVNRDGWYVNRSDRAGECFCSVGALRMAAGGKVSSETYIDVRFDEDKQDDIEVEVQDWDIDGDVNYVLAGEAENYLETAMEKLGIRKESPAAHMFASKWPNVPTFNDNSKTDDEVFAVFEKAIELAVADENA